MDVEGVVDVDAAGDVEIGGEEEPVGLDFQVNDQGVVVVAVGVEGDVPDAESAVGVGLGAGEEHGADVGDVHGEFEGAFGGVGEDEAGLVAVADQAHLGVAGADVHFDEAFLIAQRAGNVFELSGEDGGLGCGRFFELMGAEILFEGAVGQIDAEQIEMGEFAADGDGVVVFGHLDARAIALDQALEEIGCGVNLFKAIDGQTAAAAAEIDDRF